MCTGLAWSYLQLFHDITFMLGTKRWKKILDEHSVDEAEEYPESIEHENSPNAIDRLVEPFLVPL